MGSLRHLRPAAALAATIALASPSVASATTYHAAPGGSGTDCFAASCSLSYATSHAGSGDDVDVVPGAYAIGFGFSVSPGVDVHGPGADRTVITIPSTTGGIPAIDVGSGATLRGLRVNAQTSDGVRFGAGSVGSRLDVRAKKTACLIGGSPVTVDNSICYGTGRATASAPDDGGFGVSGVLGSATGSLTLTNVTVAADAIALIYRAGANSTLTLDNTILQTNAAGACTIDLRNNTGLTFRTRSSNYVPTKAQCLTAVTKDEVAGQSTLPSLEDAYPGDPFAADFHEKASSVTVAHGDNSLAGDLDLDGEPRKAGGTVDIGAYQYIAPPTIDAPDTTAIATTTATLHATVNNHDRNSVTTFTYIAAGADSPTVLTTSQSASTTGAVIDVPVAELTQDTTYKWEACVSTGRARVCAPEQRFQTRAAPATVLSSGASELRATGAKLSGTLDTGGNGSTVQFEYGPTTAYGTFSDTAIVEGVSGDKASFAVQVNGLAPATLYHARLAAAGAGGLTNGPDFTFTTTAAGTMTTTSTTTIQPPPPPPVTGTVKLAKPTTKHGVVTLKATVSGPGTLLAAARGTAAYGTATATAKKAGTITFKLKPTTKAKRTLKRKRKLSVTVVLAFTPTGGAAVAAPPVKLTVKR